MGRLARTAVVAGVAGVLVALGAALEWIRLNSAGVAFAEGGVGGSAKGIETGLYGWAAILLGVTLVVGSFLRVTTTYRRFASPLVLIGGAASLALAMFVFLSVESRFVDFAVKEAASTQLPAIKIRSLLGDLFAEGSISVRPGIGLISMALGGAIGSVAGMLGLVRTARAKPVERRPRERKALVRARQPARQSDKDRFGF